jgi:hypothetical protein
LINSYPIKGEIPWYASVNRPSADPNALTGPVLLPSKQDLKKINWPRVIKFIKALSVTLLYLRRFSSPRG